MVRRIQLFAILFLFLVLAGALSAGPPAGVKILKDLPYKSGPALSVYEQERCRLDLVLPEGARGFPVLVWFHGGSLNSQSKENLATRNLAAAFAAQGIAVAVANYRLSPRVQYPAYIDDAAAATAWVLAHVGEHGGDPKRVFVAGHSAGGYLALMLATEAKWLKAHGAVPEQLKGYIPVSYRVAFYELELIFISASRSWDENTHYPRPDHDQRIG
jgi:acetyl esterase/lipase